MRLAIGVLTVMATTPVVAHADDVLVWADAKLAIDANVGATTLQLSTAKRALGRAFVMHVVADGPGDLIEVEPGEPGCAEHALRLPDGLSTLRLFVNKADLAPAVTRAWSERWKDGGHVDVAAGAPFDPKTNALDWIIKAQLPADYVGTRFTMQPFTDNDAPELTPRYTIAGKVAFGRVVKKVHIVVGQVTKLPNGKLKVPFGGHTCVTGEVVVDAKLVKRVQEEAAQTDDSGVEGGIDTGVPGDADRWVVPKGTPLTAKGGAHVVGTLVEDLDVVRAADPAAPICRNYMVYLSWLRDSKPAIFELCARGAAAKLVKAPPPPPPPPPRLRR